jgi:hypothetical protein
MYAGLEVLTAVAIKNSIPWNISPYSHLKIHRRFEGGIFFPNVG